MEAWYKRAPRFVWHFIAAMLIQVLLTVSWQMSHHNWRPALANLAISAIFTLLVCRAMTDRHRWAAGLMLTLYFVHLSVWFRDLLGGGLDWLSYPYGGLVIPFEVISILILLGRDSRVWFRKIDSPSLIERTI